MGASVAPIFLLWVYATVDLGSTVVIIKGHDVQTRDLP